MKKQVLVILRLKEWLREDSPDTHRTVFARGVSPLMPGHSGVGHKPICAAVKESAPGCCGFVRVARTAAAAGVVVVVVMVSAVVIRIVYRGFVVLTSRVADVNILRMVRMPLVATRENYYCASLAW